MRKEVVSTQEPLRKRVEAVLDMALTTLAPLSESYVSSQNTEQGALETNETEEEPASKDDARSDQGEGKALEQSSET
jgi:hypothetical protein